VKRGADFFDIKIDLISLSHFYGLDVNLYKISSNVADIPVGF